jgi:hypothetical protein
MQLNARVGVNCRQVEDILGINLLATAYRDELGWVRMQQGSGFPTPRVRKGSLICSIWSTWEPFGFWGNPWLDREKLPRRMSSDRRVPKSE